MDNKNKNNPDNPDSMEKDDNPRQIKAKDNKVKITPGTPIQVEQFTLQDIFDSELIRMGIQALLGLMNQSVENDKASNELEKKKLDNEIEMRRLDIKKQELDIQAEKQEQSHIKWFDIRNKIYTFSILVSVIISVVVLKNYDILEKDTAKTIIIIALTIGLTSNTDLIKKLFNGKKDD